MTPERMRDIRIDCGLTLRAMARVLRLSDVTGAHHVREFERGVRKPSGPVILIYELLEHGDLPNFVFVGVEQGC